jgi:hypothetical protein
VCQRRALILLRLSEENEIARPFAFLGWKLIERVHNLRDLFFV